jgi:hypothetical protein
MVITRSCITGLRVLTIIYLAAGIQVVLVLS